MFKKFLDRFCVVNLIVVFVFLISGTSLFGQSHVGPYQVIVYEHNDYVGKSQSFDLNTRTHRIKIINRLNSSLDNNVSSIHVGSEVMAILFDHHDFHANLSGLPGMMTMGKAAVRALNPMMWFNKPSKTYGLNYVNVGFYESSSPKVQHNDIYTSMIIVPRNCQYAWGVGLYNFQDGFVRVEPIPDDKKFKKRVVPDFGSYLGDKISAVAFWGKNIRNTRVTLFEHANFSGKQLALPGPGSQKVEFQLRDYQFDRITTGVKVFVSDPQGDSNRASAPPAGDSPTQMQVVKIEPIDVTAVLVANQKAQNQQGQQQPQQQQGQQNQQKPQQQQPLPKQGQYQEPPHQEGQHQEPPHQEPPHHEGEPRPGEEHHPEGEHHPPEGEHGPVPPGVPNLLGPWVDSQGKHHELLQHGRSIVWFMHEDEGKYGVGLIIGQDEVAFFWNGPQGQGQSRGRITRKDPQGMVQSFKLDNGISFTREHEPPREEEHRE